MKKILLSLLAAGTLLLSACDPESLINGLVDELFGEATLEIMVNGQSQQFNCSSSLANNVGDSIPGTLIIGASINLTGEDLDVPYPYLGIQVADTVAGTYNLDPLDYTMFTNGNFNANDLLTTFEGRNLFIIAQSDTSWFISNGGTVVISTYPVVGNEMDGTINGTNNAVLVTESHINAVPGIVADTVAALAARGMDQAAIEAYINALPASTFFPQASISGAFTSRRMDLENVIKALNKNNQ